MSKVYTDNVEKRTGGAAIAVPASGQWIDLASAAQGDVLYHNGTSYVRLGAGTSGQFLQTTGAGANPVWASAGGDNTPMFSAYLSSTQTIADATWTKVEFDTITITDGGTYDNSTNYRWTPGVIGTYVIKASINFDYPGGNYSDLADVRVRFYLNGAVFTPPFDFFNHYAVVAQNEGIGRVQKQSDAVISMNATDYLEVYAYMDHAFLSYPNNLVEGRMTSFSAYKLIGS